MNRRVKNNILFTSQIKTQGRVISALILREIITRYGRHNIGFLWLLLEPVIFTVGVIILWNLTHKNHRFLVDITPFVVTGYSCLLLWRTCSFRGLKAIEPNRSLLHHRQVKIQDIFVARMLLEIAGVSFSFFTLLAILMFAGVLLWPQNPCLILFGWILMAWFSSCLGTILGCLSEYSEMVERLWHPASYFLLSVSGTFFMVDWLQPKMQSLVHWVPLIHPVEMMRAGYWGSSVKTHYDTPYMIAVCFIFTWLALTLMADKRLKLLT